MLTKSLAGLALGLTLSSSLAIAQSEVQYEVVITNISPGQTFTPQLVATHSGAVTLFKLGEPSSEGLEILAESGDTGPLTDALADAAVDIQTIPGLLGPGESTSVVVIGPSRRGFISMAAMMIPTNDSFVALNRVRLPAAGGVMRLAPAYDAGTEYNDQNCANIPGPQCGGAGEGYSAGPNDDDEGFVHIGNGIHELGAEDQAGNQLLDPKSYDWRNHVARITVRRMN